MNDPHVQLQALLRTAIPYQAGLLTLSWFLAACPMSDHYFVEATSTDAGDSERSTDDVASRQSDGATYADGGGTDAVLVDLPDGAIGDHPATDGTASDDGGSNDALGASADGAPDVIDPGTLDGGGTLLYFDGFESDSANSQPVGWTHVGGAAKDWTVVVDTGQVLAQAKSTNSTLRVLYGPASTSNAASVSVRVNFTQGGSSSAMTTAMVCIRYVTSDGSYQCLAIEPGVGVQVKTNLGDGPVWPSSISLALWYRLKISVDNTGLLAAFLDGTLLGTFRPVAPIAAGSIAVATQSAEAEFDDVLLTSP